MKISARFASLEIWRLQLQRLQPSASAPDSDYEFWKYAVRMLVLGMRNGHIFQFNLSRKELRPQAVSGLLHNFSI